MAFESWSRYVMRRNHSNDVMFYAQRKYLRRIIVKMEPIENKYNRYGTRSDLDILIR